MVSPFGTPANIANTNDRNGDHVRLPMVGQLVDALRLDWRPAPTMSPYGVLSEIAKIIRRFGNHVDQPHSTGWSICEEMYGDTVDETVFLMLDLEGLAEDWDASDDKDGLFLLKSAGWDAETIALVKQMFCSVAGEIEFISLGNWDFFDHNGECYDGAGSITWVDGEKITSTASDPAPYGLNGWWDYMTCGYGHNLCRMSLEVYLLWLELIGFKVNDRAGGFSSLMMQDDQSQAEFHISINGLAPTTDLRPNEGDHTGLYFVNFEVQMLAHYEDEFIDMNLIRGLKSWPSMGKYHNYTLDEQGWASFRIPLFELPRLFGMIGHSNESYLPQGSLAINADDADRAVQNLNWRLCTAPQEEA